MKVIQVKDGMLNSNYRALTCAGDQLADGWYFLPEGCDDPPHPQPYPTSTKAWDAAARWSAADVAKEGAMASERKTILKELPRKENGEWNARVTVDPFGRLSIMLKDGGWLGVKPEDFAHIEADLAPYAD